MRNLAAVVLCATTFGSCAFAEDWSVEVFLGGNDQGTLNWGGTDYRLSEGGVGGLSIQRSGLAPNLEFGLEFAFTRNNWVDYPGEDQTGASLMATARYSLGNVGPFQTYAGAGLGVVQVGYDNVGTVETANAPGGQLALGARYTLAGSDTQTFAELRYVDTFEDADLPSGNNAEYRRTDLIFGLRLGF